MTIAIRKNSKALPFNFLDPLAPDPAEKQRQELPATWNGPHVGLCITAGFQTLAKMPRRDRVGVRSCWPQYMHEFHDLVAQAEQGELERTQQQQNRTRITPSATEITHMEHALFWPAQFLQAKPELCLAVNMVALAHSLGLDAGWVAKKRGGFADTWRERYDLGCERIASGLIKDRVKVF